MLGGASSAQKTIIDTQLTDLVGIDTYEAVGADAPVPAPGSAADPDAPTRGRSYGVALRWTALQPAPTFDAFDLLNTARTWEEFRAAATKAG